MASAASITNDQLVQALRDLIGNQYFQGGGGSHSMNTDQMGMGIMGAIAPYLTGSPMLQQLISNIGGGVLGNVLSAQFPGLHGGFNVNDSLLGQRTREEQEKIARQARSQVNAGIASARDSNANNFLFNVATHMAGIKKISSNMEATSFGYSIIPGVNGHKALMSPGMAADTEAARQRLFGYNQQIATGELDENGNKKMRTVHREGLYKALTHTLVDNPYAAGGMNAGDVATVANQLGARGLLGQGKGDVDNDHRGTIDKIKKAAKSIKSIRDIIKGPLKEVFSQLEETFGAGYLNTFGEGEAADMINKMRSVAKIGGFTTQQIMSLAPSSAALVKAAGGNKVEATNNAVLTGIIMGMTRGKDKELVDEGKLTSYTMRVVTGAQQSRASKDVYAARGMLKTDEQKRAFDEKVNAMLKEGKEVNTEVLAGMVSETLDTKISESDIISRRDSGQTHKEMANSNIGTAVGLAGQKKSILQTREELLRDEIGDKKYNELLKKYKGNREKMLMATPDELLGKTAAAGNLEQAYDVDAQNRLGAGATFRDINLSVMGADEARERQNVVNKMAKLFKDSNVGAGLGVNALSAINAKDKGKTLSDFAHKLFNATHITTEQGEKMVGFKNEKNVKNILAKLKKDAADLVLDKEETEAFIEKHLMNISLYEGGSEAYFKEGKNEDGEYGEYEQELHDTRNDTGLAIRKLDKKGYADAYKEEKERLRKLGRLGDNEDLTGTQKAHVRRQKQREEVLRKLQERYDKGDFKTDKEKADFKKALDELKKNDYNINDFDDKLREHQDELGNSVTASTMTELAGSEENLLLGISDSVNKSLPQVVSLLKGIMSVLSVGKTFTGFIDTVRSTFGLKGDKKIP